MIAKYKNIITGEIVEASPLLWENVKDMKWPFVNTGTLAAKLTWIDEVGDYFNLPQYPRPDARLGLFLDTEYGDIMAVEGDVIVKYSDDSVRYCKPGVFERTYRRVADYV